jgi:hypothetical protein
MKNIFKLLGVVTVIAGTLFACSESFLDRPAQGNLDATTLANQSGVEGNLIAAYSVLDGWTNYGGWGGGSSNWIYGSAASDDAYKGSEPGDQQGVQDIELYTWATGNTEDYLNDKWMVGYDGINRANATIQLLNSVEGISPSDQDRIRGEAIFLRAFYQFEVWRIWKNVPYYTEDDVDFKKSNTAVDALPLVISDLNTAIGLLPETQSQVGRVTKWTAKALLGKVQLYAEDYSGALSTLRDVVDNGPYALEENYHKVFSAEDNNGPETVLAYQASVNDGNPNGENGNRPDRLNFPHSGSPFGCCGFHQPSQNMINAFKVDANGLPFLDGGWNDTDVTATTPVDPRIDWTAGRDGVPFLDWGIHAPGWIRDRPWAGPYSFKKSIYTKASGASSAVGWATYQLSYMNQHLLRYADVMLYLAEAEIKAPNGNLDNARTLINEIRARAAAGAQGPDGGAIVVPIDDPSITWAVYKVGQYPAAGWDADKAWKALMFERRVELGMEGQRFFDLRRWGIAKQVLNDYIAVEKTRRNYLTAAQTFEDKHMLYPIPGVQIELSESVGENGDIVQNVVQNPGW